ncbi:MAG: hypothetical protein SGI88_21815 [Candidatus Hydrogenedentes bacterium]|nr:hypothetical protein [Candidatus Hydrogenedentota bacterium]
METFGRGGGAVGRPATTWVEAAATFNYDYEYDYEYQYEYD